MADPMDKKKEAMKALTKTQLVHQINLGPKSNFSHNIPYLKTLLSSINEQESKQEREEDLEIAREANVTSQNALTLAEKSNKISIGALLVALGALVITGLVAIFGD